MKKGHYCKICGEYKANEKFRGKGHTTHICKGCDKLPVLERNQLQIIRKIDKIAEKYYISKESKELLKKYAKDKRYPEAMEYANSVLDNYNEHI